MHSYPKEVAITLDQEQANVSCLMKEQKGTKFVRERATAENIFDAERHVLSKNWNGTMKRSVIKAVICKRDGQAKVKMKVKRR